MKKWTAITLSMLKISKNTRFQACCGSTLARITKKYKKRRFRKIPKPSIFFGLLGLSCRYLMQNLGKFAVRVKRHVRTQGLRQSDVALKRASHTNIYLAARKRARLADKP